MGIVPRKIDAITKVTRDLRAALERKKEKNSNASCGYIPYHLILDQLAFVDVRYAI